MTKELVTGLIALSVSFLLCIVFTLGMVYPAVMYWTGLVITSFFGPGVTLYSVYAMVKEMRRMISKGGGQ